MTHLLEILTVLARSTTQIELNLILGGEKSKTFEFYELLQAGYGEEEIKRTLYPNGSSTSAYYKLKNRFESKLINALFLIDLSYSSFDKTNILYYHVFKIYSAARILVQRNAYKPGIRLLESLIKKSIEYEFYSIVILASKDLRLYYMGIGRNFKKGRNYNRLLSEMLPLYEQEIKAESCFLEINSWYAVKDQSGYKKLRNKFSMQLQELAALGNTKISFNRSLYLGLAYHYELLGDYWNARDIAAEAINFFKNSKRGRGPLENMLNRKMIAELNLKLYEDCTATIYEAQKYQMKYSHGWHVIKLGHLFVSMHTRDYKNAQKILQEGRSKRAFENAVTAIKEMWDICEAYVAYLVEGDKIDEYNNQAFRIKRFLNNVPVHSKQKRGFNVAILLIHILFLLQRKQYEDIMNRVESLRLYSYRYMRKSQKLRTHYFIMMIDALVKGDFRIIRVEKYASSYLKKLQAQPIDMSDAQSTLEIIPYEHMWEMILETLD